MLVWSKDLLHIDTSDCDGPYWKYNKTAFPLTFPPPLPFGDCFIDRALVVFSSPTYSPKRKENVHFSFLFAALLVHWYEGLVRMKTLKS